MEYSHKVVLSVYWSNIKKPQVVRETKPTSEITTQCTSMTGTAVIIFVHKMRGKIKGTQVLVWSQRLNIEKM